MQATDQSLTNLKLLPHGQSQGTLGPTSPSQVGLKIDENMWRFWQRARAVGAPCGSTVDTIMTAPLGFVILSFNFQEVPNLKNVVKVKVGPVEDGPFRF